jgi:hypothetical protein
VFVEVVVAAITAAIALAALVVSFVVARRQTAVQERLAAIEEARRAEEVEARTRTRVTASIVHADPGPPMSITAGPPLDSWLVLYNEGPALARSIEAEVASLDGKPVPQIFGIEALPVDLQPGQHLTFRIPMALEDAVMVRVMVRWTDGAGDHAEPFALQIH